MCALFFVVILLFLRGIDHDALLDAEVSVGIHPSMSMHDDVIKWKHFPRYWPFVRGIHRSPVNSTHKGQWRGALMLPLICVWTNAWVNNRDAGDLRPYRVHFDVTVMVLVLLYTLAWMCLSVGIHSCINVSGRCGSLLLQRPDTRVL